MSINILNSLKRAFKVNKKVVADRNDYKRQIITGNSKFNESRAELCSTVYTCVNIIANNIAKLKLNVYKTTEKGPEIFFDHKWQNTLAYNPDLNFSTAKWLHFVVTKMLLKGGIYFLKQEVSGLNIKRELKPLGEPENIIEFEGQIYFKFEKIEKWLSSSEVLFIPYLTKDGLTPVSPIAAISNELRIQHGAEQVVKNFYERNVFSLLYAKADLQNLGPADKKKAKEYIEELEKNFSGSQNAFAQGGIFFVPPLYTVEHIPLPDLKFLESSKFTESRIAAIFNIPGFMLNLNEGSSSNPKVEAQAIAFRNNCLSNITNIILSELNDKLLTIDERKKGVYIDFDYSNLFSVDYESKAIYIDKLFKMGALTINEVRQEFGYTNIDSEYANMNWIQKQNAPIQKYDTWDTTNTNILNDNNNEQQ